MLAAPFFLLAASLVAVPAPQQHTSDAASIMAGPQTPGTAPVRTPEPTLLDNDAVTRMLKAGLSDDLVLQTINSQPGRYAVDPDSLIALKNAHVSDAILSAMLNRNRRQITGSPAVQTMSAGPAEVNEIGVYYKDRDGRWVLMETEKVFSRSSGWAKNTFSNGIIKQDMNGMVHGAQARLELHRPVEFLIYTPESVTAGEYTLLNFRLNGKDREFRTMTGGIFHSESGPRDDEIQFQATRTAPRTYIFRLDEKTVGGGEYGILPPGTGNVTNGGKIYTFALTE